MYSTNESGSQKDPIASNKADEIRTFPVHQAPLFPIETRKG